MTQYMWLIEDEMLIRMDENNPELERYDPSTKKWIPDWDLSEIYTGEIRFRSLTEEEAWEKLNSLK